MSTTVAVVGLVVAAVTSLAAVGAWLVAVDARRDAARSADAAERSAAAGESQADEVRIANYLARAPRIQVETDGTVHRGLELYLTTDTDLDQLQIEVLPNPVGAPDRLDQLGKPNYVTPHQLHMDSSPGVIVEGRSTKTLDLGNLRAGQRYWISAFWHGQGRPPRAKASFRLTASAGGETWTLAESIDVALMWRY